MCPRYNCARTGRTLFERRVGKLLDGRYFNLDFGHLRALASLDRDLRYALLPLTLDAEPQSCAASPFSLTSLSICWS